MRPLSLPSASAAATAAAQAAASQIPAVPLAPRGQQAGTGAGVTSAAAVAATAAAVRAATEANRTGLKQPQVFSPPFVKPPAAGGARPTAAEAVAAPAATSGFAKPAADLESGSSLAKPLLNKPRLNSDETTATELAEPAPAKCRRCKRLLVVLLLLALFLGIIWVAAGTTPRGQHLQHKMLRDAAQTLDRLEVAAGLETQAPAYTTHPPFFR